MTEPDFFHLGPWAFSNGDYGGMPPEGTLRIPADTWQVDLTDGQTDE